MKNNATTEETNLINNLKKRKKKEKSEITCKVASNCIEGNPK